jgi:hypothetical protein
LHVFGVDVAREQQGSAGVPEVVAVARRASGGSTSTDSRLRPEGREAAIFYLESTGVETVFRDVRDPDYRSRRVFSLHWPGTLMTPRRSPSANFPS